MCISYFQKNSQHIMIGNFFLSFLFSVVSRIAHYKILVYFQFSFRALFCGPLPPLPLLQFYLRSLFNYSLYSQKHLW